MPSGANLRKETKKLLINSASLGLALEPWRYTHLQLFRVHSADNRMLGYCRGQKIGGLDGDV